MKHWVLNHPTMTSIAVTAALLAACTEDEGSTEGGGIYEGEYGGAAGEAGYGGGGSGGSATGGAISDAQARAQEIYESRCGVCHGESGAGDGPSAPALNPQPRNFTDQDWKDNVTAEDIAAVIVYGGEPYGLAPLMPPNADLENESEVVAALVEIVQSF